MNALNFDPVYRGPEGIDRAMNRVNTFKQWGNQDQANQRRNALMQRDADQTKFSNALQTRQEDRLQGTADANQEATENQRRILLSQRIAGAPLEMRANLYGLVNNQYYGGELPAYDQGGSELVTQYAALGEQPKESSTGNTDIWRYAGLAEQQWEIENPGVPMPPEKKMEAMMVIKRATAGEAGLVRDAINRSDLGYKPAIAGASEQAKADVQEATGAGVKEAETTGGLIATNNMELYNSANAAVDNISKIDGLIEHLNSSEAITGAGAEFFKDVERAKALFGSKVAAIKVADTETLDAMMGSEVFPLIKALGIGARGMDTPAEREFLRAVMTGAIPLNKDTLLRMAQGRRAAANKNITRYNKRVDQGSFNNFFRHTGIPKEKISLTPKATTKTGGDENVIRFDAQGNML